MKRPKRKKLEKFVLDFYGNGTKHSSLTEFAAKVGVSPNEVRKWIDGHRSPRDYRKHRIEKLSEGVITLYDW